MAQEYGEIRSSNETESEATMSTDAARAAIAAAADQERREKLSDETDALLDEIDDVLEENAEEFVQAYKQKGGQ